MAATSAAFATSPLSLLDAAVLGAQVPSGPRFVVTAADLPGIGRIAFGAVYLQVGTGLGHYSMRVLAELFTAVEQLRLPFIIGGDFNMVPAVLRSCHLRSFLANMSRLLWFLQLDTSQAAAALEDWFPVRCVLR